MISCEPEEAFAPLGGFRAGITGFELVEAVVKSDDVGCVWYGSVITALFTEIKECLGRVFGEVVAHTGDDAGRDAMGMIGGGTKARKAIKGHDPNAMGERVR